MEDAKSWEPNRTCQESETTWAASYKDTKLWLVEELILLLDKASKSEALDLRDGRPYLPLSQGGI